MRLTALQPSPPQSLERRGEAFTGATRKSEVLKCGRKIGYFRTRYATKKSDIVENLTV